MKKSLIFVLIAVLSAGLLFIGCSQATDSDSGGSTVLTTPEGVVVDKTISADAAPNGNVTVLATALADKAVTKIAYVLSTTDITLGQGVTIPAGKTLYLLNTNTNTVRGITPAAAGLTIHGALIVSESTKLNAETNGKVYLAPEGTLDIQAGGELEIDRRTSLTNLPTAGVTVVPVLNQVRFAGNSSLTINNEATLTVAEIETLLGYIPEGTGPARSVDNIINGVSVLTLTRPLTNVKPSEIVTIRGISLAHIVRLIPAAIEDAVTTALTIPLGATVRITQELSRITSLTVAGTLDATQDFPKVTTLAVSGVLSAPKIGDGTADVTVTVDADAVLVVTAAPIKFAPTTSSIAGVFYGEATDGKIPAKEGAEINGTIVKPGVTILSGSVGVTTVPVGETYQIVGDVTVEAAITVTGTLVVPANSSMTISKVATKVGSITGEGKVIVEADGRVSDAALGLSSALDTSISANPSQNAYTIKSVTTDLKTKTTTVLLGGSVTSGIPTNHATWGNPASGAPAGMWTWATFVGLLDDEAQKANTVIKQYNQSFLYYKGSGTIVTSDEDDLDPVPTGDPTIYIPTSGDTGIYKIRQYTSTLDPDFSVMFYNATSAKTATIEITPASVTTGIGYTVIVDWNGVNITAP
jgi:hypothetical protein